MTSSPTQPATALVTGANKGIGKQIARLLAEAGLTVHLGSRDPARGAAAAVEIGGDTRPLTLDVTDADSIAAAAERVPRLDVLVNNAGIGLDAGDAAETSLADYRTTFETNVFGVIAVTAAFLPALRAAAHPRIVNISSGTGSLADSVGPDATFPPTGRMAAYRVSKTTLNALTAFYALALPGFRVNCLAPGLRRTDLNARAQAADGDPAEAAAGAVHLALLPDDGPTGTFVSWDGVTPVRW
ncbi:SDR family NAD(P)-dependent oxidoreductase [Actinokineospora bangkokensis]|uniref:Short-chain dehydrogenase n=1 Tax=Actinokineospora bangkokensis TaxID=1193682 RepID=A0A1Q9LLZ7_9PSEU|nr:SDR family NAD(P)-dependent oxidoreductase [Actinokineospora bangkokensis]OLR93024.1 short-chain dehydrogenase [Actinokineospora bangkokensis]